MLIFKVKRSIKDGQVIEITSDQNKWVDVQTHPDGVKLEFS